VDKSKPSGEQNLVDWATPFLNDKSKVLRIMDQKLDGQFSQRGAKAAAALAVHCLRDDAKLRPTMKQILDYLEPICDSRFNSAASISSPFPAPAAATTTTVT
jgi:interleukin-1 receptor-associated kinase 4